MHKSGSGQGYGPKRNVALLTIVSVLIGTASITQAVPPAGTYRCPSKGKCVDQVINGQQCKVCTYTLCKIENGKKTDKLAGTETETTCTAQRTEPPGGIEPPPAIDLVPVNPQPGFPYCPTFGSDGKSFIVTVFNNNRTTAAPPTVTRLRLSKQGVDFYNLTRPTPGMAPGTSVNVSFPFPTTNVPTGDWIPTVTVDAGNQIAESNESNNTMTGKCIR